MYLRVSEICSSSIFERPFVFQSAADGGESPNDLRDTPLETTAIFLSKTPAPSLVSVESASFQRSFLRFIFHVDDPKMEQAPKWSHLTLPKASPPFG